MTKTCTYGLPKSEAETITDVVNMMKKKDNEDLNVMFNTALILESVRKLKQLPAPDPDKTA